MPDSVLGSQEFQDTLLVYKEMLINDWKKIKVLELNVEEMKQKLDASEDMIEKSNSQEEWENSIHKVATMKEILLKERVTEGLIPFLYTMMLNHQPQTSGTEFSHFVVLMFIFSCFHMESSGFVRAKTVHHYVVKPIWMIRYVTLICLTSSSVTDDIAEKLYCYIKKQGYNTPYFFLRSIHGLAKNLAGNELLLPNFWWKIKDGKPDFTSGS
jgi:predicted Holliday junction resolvase-like endonuclease